MTNIYIPGVDVSKWQGDMDWAKCKAAGAKYAFIRATVGAGYTDHQFERNYDELIDVGLPTGVYHVVVPRYAGKPVTADANMSNLFEAIEGSSFDFPIVLDCELTNGDNPRHITSVIEGCIRILEANGYEATIYTGAWWWDSNVISAEKWKQYPLWVANYTTAVQPCMPRGLDEWDLWQWSADGNGKGHEYGADSDSIDLNRMKVWFWNKYVGDVVPPIPPPTTGVMTLRRLEVQYENALYETTKNIWLKKKE